MAGSPISEVYTSSDGVDLAWWTLGAPDDRSVMLLHGLFSNAHTNWIRFGHAAEIASRGFRVIMPDLRAHGISAAPHDPGCYPPDILARDGLELIARLGLEKYDLGGYSLGGRTALRMGALGARPQRLIVAGMGLDGMLDAKARSDHFRLVLTGLGSHPRGSPEWLAEAFLKTTGGDPQAMLHLLDSFVDTSEAELRALDLPVLVVSGENDHDNGSAEALAERLPQGRFAAVPGNHMSAVTRPELGRALADFLQR
ncbi:MAG: alpha/beta fold hydrolase [Sphingosinicella sp.]